MAIRNSDLAKFGSKAERQTELKNYAERRPKIPLGRITEDLINQHAKEARRKLEGNKNIKHNRIVCIIINTIKCFESIAGAHADEAKKSHFTRTTTTTYRNRDRFCTANGPTGDIDSNRGPTDPPETKSGY